MKRKSRAPIQASLATLLKRNSMLVTNDTTGQSHWVAEHEEQTYVHPTLDWVEAEAIQQKFKNELEFGTVNDGKQTWTTITPWIDRKHYKLIGQALAEAERQAQECRLADRRWQLPAPLASPTKLDKPVHAVSTRPTWTGPQLLVHPYVMSKLMFMTHANGGRTEIGGFGIATRGQNPLHFAIDDFYCVPHSEATVAYHEFDLAKVHQYFIDPWLDKHPDTPCDELMAFWFHSHPGDDSTPSGVDWGTLNAMDIQGYRFMIIVGKGGKLTAHVRYHTAFGVCRTEEVAIKVDYSRSHELPAMLADRVKNWQAEYDANVLPAIALPRQPLTPFLPSPQSRTLFPLDDEIAMVDDVEYHQSLQLYLKEEQVRLVNQATQHTSGAE